MPKCGTTVIHLQGTSNIQISATLKSEDLWSQCCFMNSHQHDNLWPSWHFISPFSMSCGPTQ